MGLTKQGKKAGRGKKVLLWLLALMIVLIIGVTIAYQVLKYKPTKYALEFMRSTEQVTVTEERNWITYEPAANREAMNVILYPGGLVEAESYAPLAHQLADAGYRCYLVKMPLELAVLAPNRASDIIALAPDEDYVIGGHSLGGAMAARYAAANEGAVQGIFFLGSYADDKADLSQSDLKALQLTGSRDGILNWETWESSRGNLPPDTTYMEIEGGNHSQFGSYSLQKGDGTPALTEQEQLGIVLEAMDSWLASIIRP